MNWFRNNIKHGSRLALFALVIQLALSFGHFHAFAAHVTGAMAVSVAQSPTAPDNDQLPDACAICAVVSQASHVAFATPPVLPLPRAVGLAYLTTDTAFADLRAVAPAFRSRAPPVS